MSTKKFADCGVSKPIIATLAARGVHEPFPVQSLVIGDALKEKDLLVRSQTGSGKTLAFGIPIVEMLPRGNKMGPAALVLVPTRELASQVAAEIRSIATVKGLRVAVAYGGTSLREQARLAKKAHIVVATPGRLEDFASRGSVHLGNVSILVLDEADRMLDMGFQPQVDRIVARLKRNRQTMLFSATLDGGVGQMARTYTIDAVLHEVEPEVTAAPDVTHSFVPVVMAKKSDVLAGMLTRDAMPTIVFVRTKRMVDRLIEKLERRGVPASGMHGDMSQGQRERSLRTFTSGRVAALIATDVAARGIDVRLIERVVNFDPPDDDKAYVHRIGRTGRAGRTGVGVTFVAPEQAMAVGQMAARLNLSEEFAREHQGVPVARKKSHHARHHHKKRDAAAPARDRRPAARTPRKPHAKKRPARAAR